MDALYLLTDGGCQPPPNGATLIYMGWEWRPLDLCQTVWLLSPGFVPGSAGEEKLTRAKAAACLHVCGRTILAS